MMANPSGIVLDAIYLYLNTKDPISTKLANAVISYIEEEIAAETDVDNVTLYYYSILKEILKNELRLEHKSQLAHLIVQYKTHVARKEDPEIETYLKAVLLSDETSSPKKLKEIERRIRNTLVWAKGNQSIRKMNSISWKCGTTRNELEQDILMNDILKHARELVKAYEDDTTNDVNETIDFIDLSSQSSIAIAIEKHRQRRNQNRMKTGWQAFNDMLDGGFLKGEFVGIAALSHHAKSLQLMNIARWGCVYNSPNAPHGVIPAIIFISLENELFENTMDWYKAAYVNAFHKSPEGLSDKEICDFVADVFSKRGIKLYTYRFIGDDFGMKEFMSLQNSLKARGIYVIATIIDYMQLMKLSEDDRDQNHAKRVQNLFKSMRDFSNHSGITVITGVQLSSDAQIVADSGISYAVKKFSGGHIADSKGIRRELDCLIFQHKEANDNGVEFLTVAWNKRRYHNPPALKFFAYQFTETGIFDDLNREPRWLTDIYTVAKSSNQDDTGVQVYG